MVQLTGNQQLTAKTLPRSSVPEEVLLHPDIVYLVSYSISYTCKNTLRTSHVSVTCYSRVSYNPSSWEIANSHLLPSLRVANHLQDRALYTAVAYKGRIYLDILVQTQVKSSDPASKNSSLISASFCVKNQNQNRKGKKQILDLYHQRENEVYPVSHKSQTKVYINLCPDTFLPSIRSSIVLV